MSEVRILPPGPFRNKLIMTIAIYQPNNCKSVELAWWLCTEDKIGPQIYEYIGLQEEEYHIGPIVNEIRETDSDEEKLYHQVNELMLQGNPAMLEPYKFFTEYSKATVWSNFFGAFDNKSSGFNAQKLVVFNPSVAHTMMSYITNYAFNHMPREGVIKQSELWWKDHKFKPGLDDWNTVWLSEYQKICLDAWDEGKLKYMWQLNMLHWDVNDIVLGYRTTATLLDADNHDVVIQKKYDELSGMLAEDKSTENLIQFSKQSGNDTMVIDNWDWTERKDEILDFLELTESEILAINLVRYKECDKRRDELYYNLFGDALNKCGCSSVG